MSLPLPLANAANLFIEKFVAYNVVWSKTLGQWTGAVEPDRIISGVIQTRKEKQVTLSSDGALSDGDLMLHTKDSVSATDLSQQVGQTFTQTYVRYKNEVWKLSELTNWRPKTQDYGLYYLTKYTNIDEAIP